MKYKYSPLFCILSTDGFLKPISTFEALISAGAYPRKLDDTEKETLENVMMKNKTRPICLFMEGTTTNGRGLLEFVDVFKRLDVKKINVCIEYLKYDIELSN